MELPVIYFSGDTDSKIIVVDDDHDVDSYVILNGTLLSSLELAEIKKWCVNTESIYYACGIVKFDNPIRLYEFVLTWG
jgi:hypothetical protein